MSEDKENNKIKYTKKNTRSDLKLKHSKANKRQHEKVKCTESR